MYFLQLQVSAPAATRPAFVDDIEGSGGGSGGGEDEGGCAITWKPSGTGWWLWLGTAMMLAWSRRGTVGNLVKS